MKNINFKALILAIIVVFMFCLVGVAIYYINFLLLSLFFISVYVLFSLSIHLLYKFSANSFIFHCRICHYGVWSDNEKQTNYLTDSYLKDMIYIISFFVGPELSSDLIILGESLDDKVIQSLF